MHDFYASFATDFQVSNHVPIVDRYIRRRREHLVRKVSKHE